MLLFLFYVFMKTKPSRLGCTCSRFCHPDFAFDSSEQRAEFYHFFPVSLCGRNFIYNKGAIYENLKALTTL